MFVLISEFLYMLKVNLLLQPIFENRSHLSSHTYINIIYILNIHTYRNFSYHYTRLYFLTNLKVSRRYYCLFNN